MAGGAAAALGAAATFPAGTRLLLVESDDELREVWANALAGAGALVTTGARVSQLVADPACLDVDLVVAAAQLSDGQITDVIEPDNPVPLVAVTDCIDQGLLTSLLRRRVLDILLKPLAPAELARAVLQAVRAGLHLDRWRLAGRAAPRGARSPFDSAQLGAAGAAIARTRLPVLIVGETGTGKSRLARQLHETLTPHAPYVEVNAAALVPSLFCSEFFGHERGAFTGAHAAKPGLVAAARGGTLFLDEIGDLPLESQAHLLSFLDSGSYRPVGSLREARSDARIVCATNRDLELEVHDGRFRQDLYYRLASIVVPLPPLRAREADIRVLVQELLAHAAARADLPPPRLSEDALEALAAFDWPGNVRQLRFVLERLAVTYSAETVDALRVRALLGHAGPSRSAGVASTEVRPLLEVERAMVRRAMERAGGNRTKAARLLGITPRGLYNKLRRNGTNFQDPE